VVFHLVELQRPHWSFVCINASLALITKDEHPKLRCHCETRVIAVILRVRVTNELILISLEKMSAFKDSNIKLMSDQEPLSASQDKCVWWLNTLKIVLWNLDMMYVIMLPLPS
jgi:hypothetical protein